MCRPWQHTPCIPLVSSRFEVSAYSNELTVVSTPELQLAFTLACCACFAAAALMYPILEYHLLFVVLTLLALYLLLIQAQAVLRSLSVRQVLRVSPEGFSVTSCYPGSAMLRVLAAGMSVDAKSHDLHVKGHVVGAKVRYYLWELTCCSNLCQCIPATQHTMFHDSFFC